MLSQSRKAVTNRQLLGISIAAGKMSHSYFSCLILTTPVFYRLEQPQCLKKQKSEIAVGTTVAYNRLWSFSIIQLPTSLTFIHPLLYSHRIAWILKYQTVATEVDCGGGSLVHLTCFHLGDPSYVAIQLFSLLEEFLECLWFFYYYVGKDRYPED